MQSLFQDKIIINHDEMKKVFDIQNEIKEQNYVAAYIEEERG